MENMRNYFQTVEKMFPENVGIWLWPQRPVTVRHKDIHDKTYFTWVSNVGEAYVASFNHDTDEYVKTFMFDWNVQDDHNQPSLHIRNDGRLIVFLGGHNEPTINYKISSNPEDISTFGEMKSLTKKSGGNGYSYPQPIELADEGKIYLFYRRYSHLGANVRVWGVSVSEDNGETFVEDTKDLFFDADVLSPYTTPVGNGKDTIWFARSNWMSGFESYVRKDIRACYYKGGSFYNADGTKIVDWSGLPISYSQMEKIYDTDEIGRYTYVSDAAIDAYGNPRFAFTSLEKGTDEAGTYNGSGMNYYEYAMWDGSAWITETIVEGGSDILSGMTTHPAYNGGLMLNFDDPDEVVMGREVGGFKSKIFRIELWRRINGNWLLSSLITDERKDSTKVFRPYIPRNYHPDMKVLWNAGRYDHYTNFETYVCRTKPFSYNWLD